MMKYNVGSTKPDRTGSVIASSCYKPEPISTAMAPGLAPTEDPTGRPTTRCIICE